MEIRKSLAKQPIAYTWMSQEVRKWLVYNLINGIYWGEIPIDPITIDPNKPGTRDILPGISTSSGMEPSRPSGFS